MCVCLFVCVRPRSRAQQHQRKGSDSLLIMNLMIDFSHFFSKALQIKFSFFYSFEDRFVAFSIFFYIIGTGTGSQLLRSDNKDQ
jgi:hypothetical protein